VDGSFLERRIKKVLCTSTLADVSRMLKTHSPSNIVCITGRISSKMRGESLHGVPVLALPEDVPKLVSMINGRNQKIKDKYPNRPLLLATGDVTAHGS